VQIYGLPGYANAPFDHLPHDCLAIQEQNRNGTLPVRCLQRLPCETARGDEHTVVEFALNGASNLSISGRPTALSVQRLAWNADLRLTAPCRKSPWPSIPPSPDLLVTVRL
jgi:hypothetical protein